MLQDAMRSDVTYKFRLLMKSLSRRSHVERVCRILQHDDDSYFLVYLHEQVALSEVLVESLLNPLKSIDLSQAPLPSGGLDGTDYQLVIGSYSNAVTFNWWTDQVDSNWQPLIELRENIYRLCAEKFPEFSA